MKRVLLFIAPQSSPERLVEGVRIAAGLSQQPGLQVSLQLPSLNTLPIPLPLREYFEIFSEKGARLYADASWKPFLPPPALELCSPVPSEVGFDVQIPF